MSYQIKHFNEKLMHHSSNFLSRLTSYTEGLTMNMDYNTGYSATVRHWRENGKVLRQWQQFIDS